MKLRDLEPDFIRAYEDEFGATHYEHLPSSAGAHGVMFQCPNPSHGHMHVIWFANPVDVPPTEPTREPTHRWQRSGTTLDDLTLSPSIDSKGCWHGFIQNGEVTNA